MAFLLPQNIPSRSDVPKRLRDVARALRDFLPEEVIVWLEWTGEGEKEALRRDLGEQRLAGFEPDAAGKPYLVVLDPDAGIVVLEVPARLGGRRGRSSKLKIDQTRIRELVGQRADNLWDGLDKRSVTNLPVKVALAVPDLPSAPAADAPDTQVLDRDDFASAEALRDALHAVLGAKRRRLNQSEKSAARAAVNPDIIIKGSQNQLFSPEENRKTIRMLDQEQERLACNLGAGYRLIRGVAGSGKTLVLVYRARHIARHFPHWRILLLCYNKALSLALKNQVKRYSNVHVKTLDAHVWQVLTTARLPLAVDERGAADFEQRRRDALKALSYAADAERFDLVLVDEAQDLDEVGLDIAWASLKNGRDHFVMALDGAQRIFRSSRRRRVKWNPPGMTARGRSETLDVNYRNTRQILELGLRALGSVGDPSADHHPDDLDAFVRPDQALRDGPIPRCIACADHRAEAHAIIARVHELLAEGAAPRQIAVLVGNSDVRWHVLRLLDDPLDTKDKRKRDEMFEPENNDKIVVATLGLLKGLEYKHVIIGGANHIEIHGSGGEPEPEGQKKMLYVAITRATETLTITYSGPGPMSDLMNVPKLDL